jgi:hypothetical protein
MRHAVIEKYGEQQYAVTLHKTYKKAFNFAVRLAVSNTSDTREDIKAHLKTGDSQEEGDYGVFMCDANEVE